MNSYRATFFGPRDDRDRQALEALRRMPHVREAYHDSDGFWAIYRDGVFSARTSCGLDHEDTREEIIKAATDALVPTPPPAPPIKTGRCRGCGKERPVYVLAPRGCCSRECEYDVHHEG